jgi:tight adherence protein C
MILTLLVGLLLAGSSVALVARAIALKGLSGSARLDQIRAYGLSMAAETAVPGHGPGALGSAIDQTASRIGRWAARHLGSFREDEVRAQLMIAGLYAMSPMTFLGYRVLAALVLPALLAWVLSLTGASAAMTLIAIVLGLLSGWVLPMTYLRRKSEQRFDRIERDLPELIDVLVLTVEAGLGLSGAMQLAAGRLAGPLGDELRLTLQEQSMGLSINAALNNLLRRCDTPSMRSFVRSVVQGETLGVSLGTILRNLALEMRKRRRARAEERAQKAPIKILFPLVFLIFPSMFGVLLYPALVEFTHALGGG